MSEVPAGADVISVGHEDSSSHDGVGPGRGGSRRGRRSPWDPVRRLSDRTPLRTKLITAVLALVFIALAAVSVASTYMLRQYLITQHDSEIQAAISQVNTPGRQPPANVTHLGYAAPTQSNLVEGLQEPGSQLNWIPLAYLPGLNNPDPLPRLPTNGLWPGPNVSDTSPVFSVPAQSGPNTWRVMAETVNVTDQFGHTSTAIFVVAEDLGNIRALTTRLVLFDVLVDGAILIVLAAVGAGVVQANLRPLNDIELTAGQIAAGHLDHRVPEGDPRTEIGSLSRSLNAMLSQIERAFHAQEESERAAHRSEERMRRFIADASHELRTPLTTIRGFAAHYRQRGGASRLHPGAPVLTSAEDLSSRTEAASSIPSAGSAGAGVAPAGLTPEELDHLLGRVESEATRMGMLVEDLLTLARLDQQRPLTKGPVDLLSLAADAVQDARIVAADRSISLSVAPGTAYLVDGDEPRLRQVLANLVNNALTHTPAGTPVRVKLAPGTLTTPDGRTGNGAGTDDAGGKGAHAGPDGGATPAVVVDVEDDGPGMTAEQAQRVFERFYRADAARNRASGGTGLGLAIVAGLVAAHGGTVSVRTAPGQGADFQVRLPHSPDAQSLDDPDDTPQG